MAPHADAQVCGVELVAAKSQETTENDPVGDAQKR